MLKKKNEVRRRADKAISRSGWLGYAIGLVTLTIIAGFSLPWWGIFLVAIPAGLLWAFIEDRITKSFVEDVFESE